MSGFIIKQPGIYLQEISIQPPPIQGVSTSIVAFLGETQTGPSMPTLVTSWGDYQNAYGSYFGHDKYLPYTVEGFFKNGGKKCYISKIQNSDYRAALANLEAIDSITILYSPNSQVSIGLADALIEQCEKLKNRFAIIDSLKEQPPSNVSKPRSSSFAALYYPWICVKQGGVNRLVPPGGHVSGIYARVDIERGVNKAIANEVVRGAVDVEINLNKNISDALNLKGINTIRSFPERGIRVWGARTLSDSLETKYVNVRRLLIYVEQSIIKGTVWTAFEVNNETLWVKAKTAVENFLTLAWKAGMLKGYTQKEAYFVRCDRSTMSQYDLENRQLIILIGIAIIKPAEFIIFRVAQRTNS